MVTLGRIVLVIPLGKSEFVGKIFCLTVYILA